jgi:hypothetical protein
MRTLCCRLCRTPGDVTKNGSNDTTRIMVALVELNFDGIIVLAMPGGRK